MPDVPTTTAATFCATVVDEWARCGITDAVVAPGSRSTPMALALAADDRVRVHVHHDERSAGFMALGLATATGRPAPVLTTSGTATVELHPAVVEAHHGRVPMICCTADRPPELLHVGAPQTIDQTRLYGEAVRWFVDLGVPDDAARRSWRSVAARTVAEATASPSGPVQWNLPFRDPLVGVPGELPPGRHDGEPWHGPVRGASPPDPDHVDWVATRVAGVTGVIVAGGTGRGRGVEPDAVHDLARALGWPVLADPRSGCRTPDGTTVSHADLLVRHEGFADRHRPEVVIQVGEPAASKVQAQWLERSGAHTIVVDPDGAWFDPDRVASTVVTADPATWCRAVTARVRQGGGETGDDGDDDWLESWAAADAAAATAVATVLARHDQLTEPGVARELVSSLGHEACLVVSSSMPIRDVEWFAEARRGLRVLANRGANGIDGVVSTAVGVALGSRQPTALLIGDVALLHDVNGLLGLASRPEVDLTIVVVDNDGGGIFSFLPQAAALPAERFEQLFGTPHGIDLDALARVHRLDVVTVARPGELAAALDRAAGSAGSNVVVVRTDRRTNVDVHGELNTAVAAALS